MPIWFVIVESVDINPGGMWGYRIIKCIKCTPEDYHRLWQEHADFIYNRPRTQVMLFVREPDESPLQETGVRSFPTSDTWPGLTGNFVEEEDKVK